MDRLLIGLSFGSGLEGADAIAVRAASVGLEITPSASSAVRVAFPPSVRDGIHATATSSPSPELARGASETAVHAIRQVLTRSGTSARDVFAVGLLEPARSSATQAIPWPEIADRVAELTGLTIVHGFRHRDRAAGGSGHPITSVADYILFRSPLHARFLIHLGSVSSILYLAAGAKVSAAIGFEAGPGNQLFDALVYHGTRGKEPTDPGGKKAVQGRCLEPLWRTGWNIHT